MWRQEGFLYRAFDEGGQLLWVGHSYQRGLERVTNRYEAWWRDVRTITVEHFDDVREARWAEVQAIKTERPLCNWTSMVPTDVDVRAWAVTIRTERVRLGLTQQQLAATLATRTTAATVCRWEKGVVVPSQRRRQDLARAFGRPAQELFPFSREAVA